MIQRMTIEAPSIAAFAHALATLPHETRAKVTATEHGVAWACVEIHPLTDSCRSVFPLDEYGCMGDTRRRGQSGVIARSYDGWRALPLVIERARRMHA